MDRLLGFTFRHVTLMGGGGALLKEQEGQREEERKEGQISSNRSAGVERERERDLK